MRSLRIVSSALAAATILVAGCSSLDSLASDDDRLVTSDRSSSTIDLSLGQDLETPEVGGQDLIAADPDEQAMPSPTPSSDMGDPESATADVTEGTSSDQGQSSGEAGNTGSGTADGSGANVDNDVADAVLSPSEKLENSEYLNTAATDAELDVADAESCSSLAAVIVDQHQSLLDELGDAGRTDDAAINLAFEQSAVNSQLAVLKAAALGCSDPELNGLICERTEDLVAYGDVGEDLLAQIESSC